jgi:hypothetical protein
MFPPRPKASLKSNPHASEQAAFVNPGDLLRRTSTSSWSVITGPVLQGTNVDIGHFLAGNNVSPVAFIKQHHERITHAALPRCVSAPLWFIPFSGLVAQ